MLGQDVQAAKKLKLALPVSGAVLDHHGVCGSFFRVSIKLSRGMAAKVIG